MAPRAHSARRREQAVEGGLRHQAGFRMLECGPASDRAVERTP